MKVSIITVVYNGAETIEDAIQSVLSQTYSNIEYIIIDGGSTDGTLDIIKKFQKDINYLISERDAGIYDAMNKGINVATGDVIGILNSDDFYYKSSTISNVVELIKTSLADGIYGDLIYVDRNNPDKTIRYWKAGSYKKSNFRWGWMPPHPTVFLRKEVYKKFGLFNTHFNSAADYEFLLRIMYKNNVKLDYLPEILTKMRVGGKSNITIKNRLMANFEDLKAWKINGLNPFVFTTLLKPIMKIKQFWQKPENN